MITLEMTGRSYSGRSGCMCGCIGNYSDATRNRKLAITDLQPADDVFVNDFGREQSHGDVGNGPIAGCIYRDNGTRNRVLYLTREGVNEAIKMGYKERD